MFVDNFTIFGVSVAVATVVWIFFLMNHDRSGGNQD
jgi:hypothetical protein